MSVVSDVTVDWTVSPRVITFPVPSSPYSLTVQDISDTIRALENRIDSQQRQYYAALADGLLESEGKFQLGPTKFTGISLRLLDAKIAFEAQPGPTWVECAITDGNTSAVDSVGASIYPLEFTAFVATSIESDTSAGLREVEVPGEGLTISEFLALKDA